MDTRSTVNDQLMKLSKKIGTLQQRQLLCCGVVLKNDKVNLELINRERFNKVTKEINNLAEKYTALKAQAERYDALLLDTPFETHDQVKQRLNDLHNQLVDLGYREMHDMSPEGRDAWRKIAYNKPLIERCEAEAAEVQELLNALKAQCPKLVL